MDRLVVPYVASVHGIPESHWGCSFDTFDFTDNPRLKDVAYQFLVNPATPSLFLSGPPGLGKTHFSVALHRALIAVYGCEGADATVFTTWDSFSTDLTASYEDRSYDERLATYLEAAVFILDDVNRDVKPHQAAMLDRVVRNRHDRQLRFVLTSNDTLDTFCQTFDEHELSRLRSMCAEFKMRGRDRRLRP